MPPVDRELDDDEAFEAYLGAFRAVEQPSPAARAATWAAIDRARGSHRRAWVWLGAAVVAAAAAWLLVTRTELSHALLGARGDTPGGDQAGYQRGDEAPGAAATVRTPAFEPSTQPSAPPPAPDEPSAPPALLTPVPEPVPEPTAQPASRPRPRTAEPAGTLADETALFGAIQQALRDGQPRRALADIARHERQYPRGAFRLERMVAKAEALCATGRTEAAARLREQFLGRHGASHLAPRMRAVCGGG